MYTPSDGEIATVSWRIIGHERAVRALQHDAAAGPPALAHAYLVTGPRQIGKRTLARELAAALNCEAPAHERPCHCCRTCRMIAREAYPDLIVVERAADKRDLSVKDVREARDTIAYRPYEGRFKVYLFVDADEMSRDTFNALLLDLEEPPPRVIFVITASYAEVMAPTVQSRCRVVPLQPVPAHDIARGLQQWHGADPGEATRLAALAAGRVGWAVDALSTPDLVVRRAADVERAIALSEPAPKGLLSSRLLLAGESCRGESFLESRALCLRVLDDMLVWWRDLLLVATGSPAPLVHQDRRDDLMRQAERRGRERIARGLREIEMTAGAVERNTTPRLALEALLLRLL